MDIELLFDAHAIIGEQPTWVEDERAIYMMDVRKKLLRRLTPEGEEVSVWTLPDEIGAFALGPLGSSFAVAALRTGIYRLDLKSGACALLEPAPFDPDEMRYNEGVLDPEGRMWIGVMFDPRSSTDPPRRTGLLQSYTQTDGLRQEPDRSDLHNGMGYSPDGTIFYLTHTEERRIYAFDRVPGASLAATPRVFAEVEPGVGSPDGAAVDAKGGYWCALHGGARLRRYNADGDVQAEVPLPVSQPTMCAFAGPDLDVLIITSAAQHLSSEALAREPHAGGVFRFRPDIPGTPRRVRLPHDV